MNVYDSGRMADLLAPLGYSMTSALEEADMVIINTCHIREKASEKLYSELGRIRIAKNERQNAGADMLVAVAGCVAQAEGAEIQRRAPVVDLVVGPQSYHQLPELIARLTGLRANPPEAGFPFGRGIQATEFPLESKFDFLPETVQPQGVTAFLAIQEGCDKFCSFCVVPYTRGAEYSRKVSEITAEAQHLVTMGAREITLLGQNVNAYHGEAPQSHSANPTDTWSLARLIRHLAEAVPGLLRLRYTTSHPLEMSKDLIAAHGETGILMPFLHLPVQSGSDRILAAMNRRHSAADYIGIIEKLRAARPDLALSSDFIVGFPGETLEDFQATIDLAERIGFAQAFSFKYSPRPGTPASVLPDAVPENEKAERLTRLQALLRAQQNAFNEACLGQRFEVLFEKPGRHAGQIVGRSPYLQPVHVVAPQQWIGRCAEVDIISVYPNSLHGLLREAAASALP